MAKSINFFSIKTVIGYLIVFTGLLFIVTGLMKEAGRLYTFESEPVDVQGFSGEVIEGKLLPIKVEIPEVYVDLPVRKAEVVEGYWEVFEDSAGWGSGSGIPGESGNQVIFAHARDGLFLPLLYVKEGMEITVSTVDFNSAKPSSACLALIFPSNSSKSISYPLSVFFKGTVIC